MRSDMQTSPMALTGDIIPPAYGKGRPAPQRSAKQIGSRVRSAPTDATAAAVEAALTQIIAELQTIDKKNAAPRTVFTPPAQNTKASKAKPAATQPAQAAPKQAEKPQAEVRVIQPQKAAKQTAVKASTPKPTASIKPAPTPRPQDEPIELLREWEIDNKLHLLPSIKANRLINPPTTEQVSNARQRAMDWVRASGPSLFATSTAGFAVGYAGSHLLAQFALNALIATVPGFMPALAMGAVTGTAVTLLAKAMRSLPRRKKTPSPLQASQTALHGLLHRTFGAVRSVAQKAEAALPSLFAATHSLKKKDLKTAGQRGFAILLSLNLVLGAATAWVGYRLQSRADVSAAPDAAPEATLRPIERPLSEIDRERHLIRQEQLAQIAQMARAPLPASHALQPTPRHATEISRQDFLSSHKEPVRAPKSEIERERALMREEQISEIRRLPLPASHTKPVGRQVFRAPHLETQSPRPTTEIERERAIAAQNPVAPRTEIDRERLAPRYFEPPAQSENKQKAEAVTLPMPDFYASFMGKDVFGSLSAETQKMAIRAAQTGRTESLLFVAKEASYELLRQKNPKADHAAGQLIKFGVTLAYKEGLTKIDWPQTPKIVRALNADYAYLFATGRGGFERDYEKATTHLLFAGQTDVSNAVERIVQARAPETYKTVKEDHIRFCVVVLGLS